MDLWYGLQSEPKSKISSEKKIEFFLLESTQNLLKRTVNQFLTYFKNVSLTRISGWDFEIFWKNRKRMTFYQKTNELVESDPRLCVCICLIVILSNLKKSDMRSFPRLDPPKSKVEGMNTSTDLALLFWHNLIPL